MCFDSKMINEMCMWGQPFRVRGCILTLVERMDEEFTKIMQNTDPHSQGENWFKLSVKTSEVSCVFEVDHFVVLGSFRICGQS